MNTKQIINEAEGQLWLGDTERDVLHEHNRGVIKAAIEKAEREWEADVKAALEMKAVIKKSRAARASEPDLRHAAQEALQELADETAKYCGQNFDADRKLIHTSLQKAYAMGYENSPELVRFLKNPWVRRLLNQPTYAEILREIYVRYQNKRLKLPKDVVGMIVNAIGAGTG